MSYTAKIETKEDKAYWLCKVYAGKKEQRVLKFLKENPMSKANYIRKEVFNNIRPQPEISTLLKRMRIAGLIEKEEEGRYVRFRVNDKIVNSLEELTAVL